MNDKTRIRLRQRGGESPKEGENVALIRRLIAEELIAAGLGEFRLWQEKVESQLQVLRIIHHDLREAAAIAYTNQGSAKSKVQELLEGAMSALVNVDELMQPGDVPEPTEPQQLLARVFDRFREPVDVVNEAVESDDFVDPVEAMFDPDGEPPRRGRRA